MNARVFWLFSGSIWGLYAFALALPAENAHRFEGDPVGPVLGYQALLGLWVMPVVVVEGANLALIVGWLMLLSKRPWPVVWCGLIGTLAALTPCFGVLADVGTLGLGYWLWLASIVLLLGGGLWGVRDLASASAVARDR